MLLRTAPDSSTFFLEDAECNMAIYFVVTGLILLGLALFTALAYAHGWVRGHDDSEVEWTSQAPHALGSFAALPRWQQGIIFWGGVAVLIFVAYIVGLWLNPP
jgi:hypothetical protein